MNVNRILAGIMVVFLMFLLFPEKKVSDLFQEHARINQMELLTLLVHVSRDGMEITVN